MSFGPDPLEFLRRAVARSDAENAVTNSRSERTCENCRRREECWAESIATNFLDLLSDSPESFTPRDGWDAERYVAHMKCIFAQVCMRFANRHPEIRERQERREREDAEKAEERKTEAEGWDR